jgi:hypothetical protein
MEYSSKLVPKHYIQKLDTWWSNVADREERKDYLRNDFKTISHPSETVILDEFPTTYSRIKKST